MYLVVCLEHFAHHNLSNVLSEVISYALVSVLFSNKYYMVPFPSGRLLSVLYSIDGVAEADNGRWTHI